MGRTGTRIKASHDPPLLTKQHTAVGIFDFRLFSDATLINVACFDATALTVFGTMMLLSLKVYNNIVSIGG